MQDAVPAVRAAYDVTRRETFESIEDIWMREVDMYSTVDDAVKIVVANKVDKARQHAGLACSTPVSCRIGLLWQCSSCQCCILTPQPGSKRRQHRPVLRLAVIPSDGEEELSVFLVAGMHDMPQVLNIAAAGGQKVTAAGLPAGGREGGEQGGGHGVCKEARLPLRGDERKGQCGSGAGV